MTMPALNGWLSLMALVTGALWLWRERHVRPIWIVGFGLVVIVTAFLPLKGGASLAQTLKAAFVTHDAVLGLAGFLAVVCAWLWLWRGQIEERLRTPLALLVAFASWNTLAYFPWADQFHLLWVSQPLFVILVFLAYRLSQELQKKMAEPRRRWLAPATIGTVLACVCAIQFCAVVGHFWNMPDGIEPQAFELVDAERADVYMPASIARSFRKTAQAVQKRTDANDAVFDTCGSFINFIAQRRNPTGVDFTWVRLHTPAEQARMVEQLRADPPALILRRTVDEKHRPAGFPSVRESYPDLFDFIEENYVYSATVAEYALWIPK